MADLNQLKRALVNADKAGDTDAARKLASAIRAQTTDTGRVQEMNILPLSRADEDSSWEFDTNAGLLGSLKRAIMGPGTALQTPPGHQMQEGDAMNDAGDIIRNGRVVGNAYVDQEALNSSARDAAAWFSPMGAAARSMPKFNASGSRKVKNTPEPPTSEQLLKTGSAQFDKGRTLGVKFEPAYINKLGELAEVQLTQKGFGPDNAPQTFGVLKGMQSNVEKGAYAAYDDILKIRSKLQKARTNFNNPQDKAAAEQVIRAIEKFVANAPRTGAVRSGPSDALAKLHSDALGNYAAAKRSGDLGALSASAVRRAKSSNSGQNIGNTIRQRAASLLDSPKKLQGLSKEEIAALERVNNGTATQNTLRAVSHWLGGGGGMGQTLATSLGATAGSMLGGGIPGAIAGGVGVGAMGSGTKALSNRLTLNAMRGVDKMTRMRSPLYQEMINSAAWKSANTSKRSAMLKAFLAYEQLQRQMQE